MKKGRQPKIEFMPFMMAAYVIITLCGMLLVFHDFYYDILETKRTYYTTCTVVMLVLTGIYMFLMADPVKAMKNNKGKKLLEIISLADLFVILWGVVIILSTILSPEKRAAFLGTRGRYTGCRLLLLYVAAYFCITRYYRAKEWHMAVFLGAGMLMCLFGITDFFDMDLLGFKEEIKEIQRYMFSSTIGNINTYTSCVAMVMAFAGVMFAASDSVKKAAAYGVCTFISFFALIVGESDNAYLSLAAFFGLLPLYLFRTRTGIKRYFALIAGFFTAAKAVSVLQTTMADQVIPINGLFQVIGSYRNLTAVVLALWCVTVICYLADYFISKPACARPADAPLSYKSPAGAPGIPESMPPNQRRDFQSKKSPSPTVSPWLVRGWIAVLILVALAGAYMFYDVNVAGNGEKYGSLQQYLWFDDEWGTHRGYIWRIAIEDYQKFPLPQKIFGYGPDTFGIVTRANNYPEMFERYNETFDSVHNEYLQYLVTIGPLGLLAYLGIHGAVIWQVIKEKLNQPVCVAALFAVLCYAFQAAVNINQPIAAPVMWTLLAVSVSKVGEKTG